MNPNSNNFAYLKYGLLTIVCISHVSLIACSQEERLPTEEEYIIAKAWLACSKQEKWEKAYKQVGIFGTKTAIRKECGAKPPYVTDENREHY